MRSLLQRIFYVTFTILSVLGHVRQERRGRHVGISTRRNHHTNRNIDHQQENLKSLQAHHRTTNAERFAQGLPPLPPRKLYKATTSHQEPNRARASPVALGRFRIRVYDSMGRLGTSQGYVGSPVDSSGHFHLVGDATGSVVATYDNKGAIKNTESSTTGHHYLGFVNPAGSTNDNDEEGGWLAATRYAPPGSPPVPSQDESLIPTGNKDTYETSVWSIGSGNELIASWYDQNGRLHSMVLLLVQGDFLLVERTASVAPNVVRLFAEAV